MILNRLGHEVVGVADSHDEAIRVAEVTRPDFAFVDVKLRDGFTGIEAARRLRTEFGLFYAFVTGNAEQISGDDVVVRKPFTPTTIAMALGHHPAA